MYVQVVDQASRNYGLVGGGHKCDVSYLAIG